MKIFNPSPLFLIWWLISSVQGLAIGAGIYFGMFEAMLEADTTRLSFVILTIWSVVSLQIGYKAYKHIKSNDTGWFLADSCMTIGMIGTVIGFLMMLTTSFASIDPSDIESMRGAISSMAQGMGTALVTTLAGLIISLFLKLQLVFSEQ